MTKSKIGCYIKQHGLTLSAVAKEAGISRQALSQYGEDFSPTLKTLNKVAIAMTELGAPTTVVELLAALLDKSYETKIANG